MGAAQLDQDLPRVLRVMEVDNLDALGWQRPNKLTLLVPMTGVLGERRDNYLLKLGFHSYRAWPPSAQFVNPDSVAFVRGQDDCWVPRLTSNECRTHLTYGHPRRGDPIQLICCSATLEFYDVNHGVEPHHVWDGKSTFYTTIAAIRRAFTTSYEGRFGDHG